ncbi:MAG: hypothetical protein ACRC2O_03740 [Chitinophagaceae bacterium]
MKKQNIFYRFLKTRGIPIFLVCALMIVSCNRKDTSSAEEELISAGRPENYQENDTLKLNPLPENIAIWINYYQQFDTAFNRQNFKASGVTVHLDSMEDATTGDLLLMENFFPLFSYSPDSSQIIDFWSYNQLIEINKAGEHLVIGGDPDQEVVWINKKTGAKKQIMYNGPLQIVETADWINDQSFIIGMINIDETNTSWTPEILLFNLSDTTFTNFRLQKSLPAEKLVIAGANFTSFWLKQKNYKRG